MQGLAVIYIDLMTVWICVWKWFGLWLSTIFTIWWDPLLYSQSVIPLRGRCRYSGCQVTSASTRYDQRSIAGFYRWNDTPTESDWQRWFGPCTSSLNFTIRLWEGAEPTDEYITVSEITMSTGDGSRGSRTLTHSHGARTTIVMGPTPIGGLALTKFIRDVARAAERL